MRTKYLVKSELSYPTDAKALKRLMAGEDVPLEERKEKTAAIGSIVDDIPETSVPWLLEQGLIEISAASEVPTPSESIDLIKSE